MLNLATRRSGNTAKLDEYNGINLDSMLLSNSLTNGVDDPLCIAGSVTTLYFLHNHESLFPSNLNRKSCATPWRQEGRTLLYSQLDILWIMMASPNNDEVPKPPGNIEFTIMDETKVSRALKRATTKAYPPTQSWSASTA
jgi:hypothetical protein